MYDDDANEYWCENAQTLISDGLSTVRKVSKLHYILTPWAIVFIKLRAIHERKTCLNASQAMNNGSIVTHFLYVTVC